MTLLPFAALPAVLLMAWDLTPAPAPPPPSGPVQSVPAAVGTLVDRDGGFCSASLYADAAVITAGHCLFGPDGREIVAPFVFRTRDPETGRTIEAEVSGWVLAPGYNESVWEGAAHLRHLDWALITLAQPLGERVGTIPIAQVSSEALLAAMATGYSYIGFGESEGTRGKIYAGCRVAMWNPDGSFFDHCDTVEGDSGGPALALIAGRLHIVAVVSSELPMGGDQAVASSAFAEAAAALLARGPDAALAVAGLVETRWQAGGTPAAPQVTGRVRAMPGEAASLTLACPAGRLSARMTTPFAPGPTAGAVSVTVDTGEGAPVVLTMTPEGDAWIAADAPARLLGDMRGAARASSPDAPRIVHLRYASEAGSVIELSLGLADFARASADLARACPAPPT